MNQKEKKAEMYERIKKHGENLNALFNTGIEPVELCKKLRRIESKLDALSVRHCNGNLDTEMWDLEKKKALKQIDKILGYKTKGIPVFINSDPRGYAIKIKSKYIRENNISLHRDWGGYGIVAPDLTDND